MLERLDTIPWSRIKCQVGYASHVPTAVRDLLSDDLKTVKAAYWRLENHVVVSGMLYEAAAYLPEILIEALDLTPHKEDILELLFQIGNGYSLENPDELRRTCYTAVTTGLEQWLARSPEAESEWREAAMQNLADLRKYAETPDRRF